jgi:hypothetical protein
MTRRRDAAQQALGDAVIDGKPAVLFVMRQAGEVGKLGHPELESWPAWSRQSPFDSAAYIPSSGEMSRYSECSVIKASLVMRLII